MRGLRLALYSGDGRTGSLDGVGDGQSTTQSPQTDPTEAAVYAMSVSFHERLAELGIDHTWHVGPGRHRWAYWNSDLRHVLPFLLSAFH